MDRGDLEAHLAVLVLRSGLHAPALAAVTFPWASVASVVLKRAPAHERGSTVGVLSAFYDLFVGSSSFAAGG